MIAHYLESTGVGRRTSVALVLALALTLLAAVVTLEWLFALDYSLGVLYVVPVAVAATVLTRQQTLTAAVCCALFRGWFTPDLPTIEFWLRFAMALLAYGGVGVLVTEVSRNRRALLEAMARQQAEHELRRHAEHQLRILVESSPAAIMTLDGNATVLAANRAAHEMLGFAPDTLVGRRMADQVPVFTGALRVADGREPIRVSSTCWAQRANGTRFPASVWFSTYQENGATYLAGILVDTSEDVREREHEMLRQVADSNRLLAGAVAHEIRNLCSAIRAVTFNLRRQAPAAADPDVTALGTLVESLMRIAAFELSSHTTRRVTQVDLARMLEGLRVVIEPDWHDIGGEVTWTIDGDLPAVRADEHALLQVFLNLSHNSLRAVQQGNELALHVRAASENGQVVVSFEDSGPGIADATVLFQPFREHADGSGLGLYVSRAMMRVVDGELVHVPVARGCRFDVRIQPATVARSQVA